MLVVGQIKGEFEAKEERMQKYLKLTKLLTLILSFLQDRQLPQDVKEARKVR